jgi:hypothetical protein
MFALCGVPLKVTCQTASQLTRISNLWHRFFSLEDERESEATVIYFFAGASPDDSSRQIPPGVELFRSAHLVVLKTDRGFHFRCYSSFLDVDVEHGQCLGVLTDEFWDVPLEFQREFFLLSFLAILRPLGRYGLHANGLLNDGIGYLIVGDRGNGKTTLSLALVREGWGFLSDDVLTLQETQQGIKALALRRGFSCTMQTALRYPEFKSMVDEAPSFLNGKKLVDISQEYPDSFYQSCFPSVLLFPKITDELHSRLVRIDPTQSVVGLLEQSPGILIEKPRVIEQMNVLKLLVNQARCYQLQLGTDIFEAPKTVAELLSSVLTDD